MKKLISKYLNLNFSKTFIIHIREKESKLSNKRSDNLNNYLKTIKYLPNYYVNRITTIIQKVSFKKLF